MAKLQNPKFTKLQLLPQSKISKEIHGAQSKFQITSLYGYHNIFFFVFLPYHTKRFPFCVIAIKYCLQLVKRDTGEFNIKLGSNFLPVLENICIDESSQAVHVRNLSKKNRN